LVQSLYCSHALADSNQCIRIREKTLEFSSTVSLYLDLYLRKKRSKIRKNVNVKTFL